MTRSPLEVQQLRDLTRLRRVRDRIDRATLAFYRNDVEYGGMNWITVGPVGQSGTSIVLYPPAATRESPMTSAALSAR